MADYEIRLVKLEDVNETANMVNENYSAIDESRNSFMNDMYSPENFKIRLEHKIENAYVAVLDNEIIGMLSFMEAGPVVTVIMIVVKADMKFSGVAANLLTTFRKSIEEAGKVSKVIAYTEHTNKESMIILIRFGFIPEGFIHHGYAPNLHMISWGLFTGDIPTP